MSAERTLADVIAALDSAGARHMIVGSIASTHHGEPRATQDIDIVVELRRPELDRFLQALPDDEWYVDREIRNWVRSFGGRRDPKRPSGFRV